jgi:hypothetical protein
VDACSTKAATDGRDAAGVLWRAKLNELAACLVVVAVPGLPAVAPGAQLARGQRARPGCTGPAPLSGDNVARSPASLAFPQGTKINSKGKEVPHGTRLYSIASTRYGDNFDGMTVRRRAAKGRGAWE